MVSDFAVTLYMEIYLHAFYKLLVKTKEIVQEKTGFQSGFEFLKSSIYLGHQNTENLRTMIYESFILEHYFGIFQFGISTVLLL